ncbi:MAG: DNA-binding protein [Lachnospiraceae bacterium]|nr:DNA-binding protein [Lachnospiraceae bacterium]
MNGLNEQEGIENNSERIPLNEKYTLTIKEAVEYTSIGTNKLQTMLRNPRCPFVLYVGTKKLVKRKEFEEYLSGKREI